jgi:hypothetical protein
MEKQWSENSQHSGINVWLGREFFLSLIQKIGVTHAYCIYMLTDVNVLNEVSYFQMLDSDVNWSFET